MRWGPRVAKRACFLVEERKEMDGHAKRRGTRHTASMCQTRNLSSNKGPRSDQISASCEGFVQLWPEKIVGDLYRERTGTTLLGDGSGQSDASGELLLSMPQVGSILNVALDGAVTAVGLIVISNA